MSLCAGESAEVSRVRQGLRLAGLDELHNKAYMISVSFIMLEEPLKGDITCTSHSLRGQTCRPVTDNALIPQNKLCVDHSGRLEESNQYQAATVLAARLQVSSQLSRVN